VEHFQQQTSMDLLEAEWDALRQGTQAVNAYYAKFVELCNAVQADITSAIVVRKFLRHLNPLIYSNLIIHFGGRIECIEGMDRVIGPFPSNPSGPLLGFGPFSFILGNFLPRYHSR
jgi:hypothetical protein